MKLWKTLAIQRQQNNPRHFEEKCQQMKKTMANADSILQIDRNNLQTNQGVTGLYTKKKINEQIPSNIRHYQSQLAPIRSENQDSILEQVFEIGQTINIQEQMVKLLSQNYPKRDIIKEKFQEVLELIKEFHFIKKQLLVSVQQYKQDYIFYLESISSKYLAEKQNCFNDNQEKSKVIKEKQELQEKFKKLQQQNKRLHNNLSEMSQQYQKNQQQIFKYKQRSIQIDLEISERVNQIVQQVKVSNQILSEQNEQYYLSQIHKLEHKIQYLQQKLNLTENENGKILSDSKTQMADKYEEIENILAYVRDNFQKIGSQQIYLMNEEKKLQDELEYIETQKGKLSVLLQQIDFRVKDLDKKERQLIERQIQIAERQKQLYLTLNCNNKKEVSKYKLNKIYNPQANRKFQKRSATEISDQFIPFESKYIQSLSFQKTVPLVNFSKYQSKRGQLKSKDPGQSLRIMKSEKVDLLKNFYQRQKNIKSTDYSRLNSINIPQLSSLESRLSKLRLQIQKEIKQAY